MLKAKSPEDLNGSKTAGLCQLLKDELLWVPRKMPGTWLLTWAHFPSRLRSGIVSWLRMRMVLIHHPSMPLMFSGRAGSAPLKVYTKEKMQFMLCFLNLLWSSTGTQVCGSRSLITHLTSKENLLNQFIFDFPMMHLFMLMAPGGS